MQTFPLGSFTVDRVGYGAMQLPGPGVFGPPRDHDQAIAVLRRAVELGVNHIDTAQFYGPERRQRTDPRGTAPVPGRTSRWSARSARAATTQGNWIAGAAARRTARRHRGEPARPSASTGSPRSTCASTRGDPNAVGDGRPRAVRPSADRDDRRPRRRADRRHRAEQHLARASARSRWTAPRSSRCRTPTTWSTGRRSRCSTVHRARHLVRAVLPARLGASPPTTRCSAIPPSSRQPQNSAARPAQIALAWTLSVAPNVLLIPGTSSVAHLEENLAVADIELPDDVKRELDDAA